MISLLEALHFRSLRYVRQSLDSFHVLVGPNASGKSTFLEVVSFLGKLVSEGVEKAVGERTENFLDLVWNRCGTKFELAVEARISEELKRALGTGNYSSVRYEVAISAIPSSGEIGISKERLFLFAGHPEIHEEILLFPHARAVPDTILTGIKKGVRTIVSKSANGNSNFNSETHTKPGKGWINTFKLSPQKSALGTRILLTVAFGLFGTVFGR